MYKTCLTCKHLCMETRHILTGDDVWGRGDVDVDVLACGCGHWKTSTRESETIETYRMKLTSAMTCKDYENHEIMFEELDYMTAQYISRQMTYTKYRRYLKNRAGVLSAEVFEIYTSEVVAYLIDIETEMSYYDRGKISKRELASRIAKVRSRRLRLNYKE